MLIPAASRVRVDRTRKVGEFWDLVAQSIARAGQFRQTRKVGEFWDLIAQSIARADPQGPPTVSRKKDRKTHSISDFLN